MAITAGKLKALHDADPDGYQDELRSLLGITTDEDGFQCIRDPVFKPRQLSIKDVGEAFLGSEGMRRLYERGPGGIRGGRAQTVAEEIGGGALGPSEFTGLNAWLGTVDGLLGGELLAKYSLATMIARELVTWKLNVKTQEQKQIRYGFPSTAPTQDLQPGQEFPAGDLSADWIRTNRMLKQGEVLNVTWEAMHFDQTDSLMEAVSGDQGLAVRFAVTIDERIQRSIWGIDNTYNRLGTITNTYLTSGAYTNKITNQLLATTTCIDVAEQVLLAQTDPNTGLEIAPPDDTRFLVTTPYKFLTATRLATPYSEEIGALSDASRMQLGGPPPKQYVATIKPYRMIRATRLMIAGLALTLAQVQERWLWGSTKGAFQYRSAKDITTYRYSITDSPALARRDVLMEIDVSEMGAVTTVEPRMIVLNVKDS